MEYSDDIIIAPVVTEKSNVRREQHKYTFKVDARANKKQIMKAITVLFKVKPVACNIMNIKGKPKRVRYQRGYTSTWKKAIITLHKGEKIDIFEGV
jgi:large subunit ribosomal protein L23